MSRKYRTLIGLAALALAGCTLPGADSPTPFSFPTPDLTLTRILGPTDTPIPPTAILAATETELSPTETATAEAGEQTPGAPTATSSTQDARPNGTPVTAPRLDSPPEIDGDLSDWSGSTSAINQNVFGSGNWSGNADASGSFYIGWDNSALYLGVRVTDNAFVQVSSGRNMFKGDIVELQLDANLQADFFSTRLSNDDYQIGLSPGNFGSISSAAYRWYPIGQAGSLSAVSVAAVSTSSGYNLEAKIPWTVFGVTAAEGANFGFALSISDNDLAGQAVQQSMVSNVQSRTLTNPTTWGTLILGP